MNTIAVLSSIIIVWGDSLSRGVKRLVRFAGLTRERTGMCKSFVGLKFLARSLVPGGSICQAPGATRASSPAGSLFVSGVFRDIWQKEDSWLRWLENHPAFFIS